MRSVARTRRGFLQLAASTLGTATFATAFPAPTRVPAIRRVETFPVWYPVSGHFKFLGARGRPAVVVKVTAEDGTVGWGQSVPIPTWSYETIESVSSTIDRYLAPVLIGRNPFDLSGAHRVMEQAIRPGFTTGMPIAKAGIDVALHDLAGKLSRQTLAERWGRADGAKITLSWTVNPRTLDEVDELIEQGWSRGYRNFNIKVAPDLKFDLELCRRVKKRAPDGFLWADANGGYDLATAMRAAPKLADAGVAVLEQPLPANRMAAYGEIRKQGALPIILDEGVVSPADLVEFIRLGMLDGVAMKPARVGGLLPARRQIEILEDAGLMFLGSGLTDPDVSLAASVALYAAYGLRFPAALNGPQFLAGSILTAPLVPVNGELQVPAGFGLGVEVDEDKLASLIAASR